jgi:hypothetical protein
MATKQKKAPLVTAVGALVQCYEKRVNAKSPLLFSNGSIGDWFSRN